MKRKSELNACNTRVSLRPTAKVRVSVAIALARIARGVKSVHGDLAHLGLDCLLEPSERLAQLRIDFLETWNVGMFMR